MTHSVSGGGSSKSGSGGDDESIGGDEEGSWLRYRFPLRDDEAVNRGRPSSDSKGSIIVSNVRFDLGRSPYEIKIKQWTAKLLVITS